MIYLSHFIHTILSVPFYPYHFVQYHFIRIPFCPCHFVRTILSATILSYRTIPRTQSSVPRRMNRSDTLTCTPLDISPSVCLTPQLSLYHSLYLSVSGLSGNRNTTGHLRTTHLRRVESEKSRIS